MTILSVFFEVISPKHTRARSSLKQWPRSRQTARCSLQTARGFQIAWNRDAQVVETTNKFVQ